MQYSSISGNSRLDDASSVEDISRLISAAEVGHSRGKEQQFKHSAT